jgi:hypothetical protein
VFGCWDWSSTSCGHRCKDTRSGSLIASCGDYSPDCGDSCTGMCGPSCMTCWPGVCGDCCLWEGCYIHDNNCRVGAIVVQMGYGCVGGALDRITIDRYQGQQGKVNWCTGPSEDDAQTGGGSSGGNSCRCESCSSHPRSDSNLACPQCALHVDIWSSGVVRLHGTQIHRQVLTDRRTHVHNVLADANDGECDVPAGYCSVGTDGYDCCGSGGGDSCRCEYCLSSACHPHSMSMW